MQMSLNRFVLWWDFFIVVKGSIMSFRSLFGFAIIEVTNSYDGVFMQMMPMMTTLPMMLSYSGLLSFYSKLRHVIWYLTIWQFVVKKNIKILLTTASTIQVPSPRIMLIFIVLGNSSLCRICRKVFRKLYFYWRCCWHWTRCATFILKISIYSQLIAIEFCNRKKLAVFSFHFSNKISFYLKIKTINKIVCLCSW